MFILSLLCLPLNIVWFMYKSSWCLIWYCALVSLQVFSLPLLHPKGSCRCGQNFYLSSATFWIQKITTHVRYGTEASQFCPAKPEQFHHLLAIFKTISESQYGSSVYFWESGACQNRKDGLVSGLSAPSSPVFISEWNRNWCKFCT